MATLKDRGFINYYGMQRFGTAPIPTHVIGLALLRSDWDLAVKLILMPRAGEGDDVAHARQVFDEGKLDEAVRLMPRRAVAEKAILEQYQRSGSRDSLAALSKIPKNLRMMYVHAWQSYIWNRVVSERVKLHGCTEPIVGDLVYVNGDATGDGEAELAAEEPEPEVVESLDPNLDDGRLPGFLVWASCQIVTDGGLLSYPTDLPTATTTPVDKLRTTRIPPARLLTQQDIDAKTYSIFDIILPMPGFSIIYPAGQLGETYRDIIKGDKLDSDNLFRKQKEYSLVRSGQGLWWMSLTDQSYMLILGRDLPQDDAPAHRGVAHAHDVHLIRPRPGPVGRGQAAWACASGHLAFQPRLGLAPTRGSQPGPAARDYAWKQHLLHYGPARGAQGQDEWRGPEGYD